MPGQDETDAAEDDLAAIDRKADEFEEAWRRGQRPTIEDFLSNAVEVPRTPLLLELLIIEWQRRSRLGEQPETEEYVGRFPERADWIRTTLTRERNRSPATPVGANSATISHEFPVLNEYEILEKIGGGGMGVVYLARKRTVVHGGVVALKMIADHLLSHDSVGRFVNEMTNQARFQHPHIVQVLDSGQEGGRPYFTMIFYGGCDLARVLKKHGPLEPRTAALYISRIAWAVHFLHDRENPVLHGDLKPQNILLDQYNDGSFPFGRPYLADFGLVTLFDKASPIRARRHRGNRAVHGAEQVEAGAIVPASDVWGLGVILFESLTGHRPFRGETKADLIYQILHRETASPRVVRPEIPRNLERICLKCLKKPLPNRYQSASELIADLNCFFASEPLVHARPETLGERVIQRARRAPALAARLAVVVACSAIIWAYPAVTGGFAVLEPDNPIVTMFLPLIGVTAGNSVTTSVVVFANQVILVAWGLVSWAFQRRLERSRREDGIQLGWRIADVTTLVLLIQLDDALLSPLTVAFAVLIVASAFGSRAKQIIETTLLSMVGYGILAFIYKVSHPDFTRPYRHFHYLTGLAVLCVMLVYQANRTRALARIGEERLRA